MAELYMQVPLFPGANEIDQLNKMVKILGTPDKAMWPEGHKLAQARNYYFPDEKGQSLVDLIPAANLEAIDLMESMLQYQSRKRPTALEYLCPYPASSSTPTSPTSLRLPRTVWYPVKFRSSPPYTGPLSRSHWTPRRRTKCSATPRSGSDRRRTGSIISRSQSPRKIWTRS